MNTSTKSVLLSALVFPGAGHTYLKKYLHGACLMGNYFASIHYVASDVVDKALQIAEQKQNGDVQPDSM